MAIGKKYMSRRQKGFTLIEVIVSIAVLAILIFSFVNFIGFSFTNVFVMGDKSKAIVRAREKIDVLDNMVAADRVDEFTVDSEYISSEALESFIRTNSTNGRWFSYKEALQQVEEHGVNGYGFTVIVFYHNGKRYIRLESFSLKPI